MYKRAHRRRIHFSYVLLLLPFSLLVIHFPIKFLTFGSRSTLSKYSSINFLASIYRLKPLSPLNDSNPRNENTCD